MNSRWLYRAAGTVGLASGFLLLGAASAQAEEAGGVDESGTEDALAIKDPVGTGPASAQIPEGDPVSDLLGGLLGGSALAGGDPLSGLVGGVPAGALPATTLPTGALPASGALPTGALPASGALPTGALPASGALAGNAPSADTLPGTAALPAQQLLPAEAVDPLGLPVVGVGEQLPALIGEQLAGQTGLPIR